MTSPSPSPSPNSSPASKAAAGSAAPKAAGLGKDTLAALGAALATENAAVWSYGVVAAFLKDAAALISTLESGHLSRRDATATLITQGGGRPAQPAAAYKLPTAVKDAPTAFALAIILETDCATAWRAVVGSTDRSDLRGYALAGLSDSAVWLTQLKLGAKVNPPTVPLPGHPA